MGTVSEYLIAGLLLACALFTGRGAASLGFPRVAAHLIVGILFSPDILGDRLGLHPGTWTDGSQQAPWASSPI